jgi:acylphosphatase
MKKHLIISGKVQGVGFRYWLQKLAIEKNICGWVKNKTSGNVEALIVGEEKEVRELIKLCEMGPGSAKIDYVQINDYNKDYIKKDFDIVKSD